jgi:predicted nucleic acid-binding protein
MILTDLVDGESVFLDANILVYHFAPHPQYGQACHDLIQRVENQALLGYMKFTAEAAARASRSGRRS